MLVGGTLGGKSVCWKTLAKAKCILKSMGQEGALASLRKHLEVEEKFHSLYTRGIFFLHLLGDSQTINVIQLYTVCSWRSNELNFDAIHRLAKVWRRWCLTLSIQSLSP